MPEPVSPVMTSWLGAAPTVVEGSYSKLKKLCQSTLSIPPSVSSCGSFICEMSRILIPSSAWALMPILLGAKIELVIQTLCQAYDVFPIHFPNSLSSPTPCFNVWSLNLTFCAISKETYFQGRSKDPKAIRLKPSSITWVSQTCIY